MQKYCLLSVAFVPYYGTEGMTLGVSLGVPLYIVWFPDPSVMRMRGRGKKGLGNNYTLARARGWNFQKVLESISSRCYTNFCPQVVLATCTIRLRNCLFVNIHDRVTLSDNHSHLEVRAGQIPGPVPEYSYFPDPSFPSRACA